MQALLNQQTVSQVRIILPEGQQVDFRIEGCVFDNISASCSVIRDAGQRPRYHTWRRNPGDRLMAQRARDTYRRRYWRGDCDQARTRNTRSVPPLSIPCRDR